ncbi:DUF4832 domain-containing protein [Reichenbachiella sp. MALMAid0571]|uniref:DUF4832 domain-containing protein n=1 Tax=Reichenbachiella sp. MALMAid0571 TaxID=3143939 RepID=UPI0032DE3C88
MKKLVFKIFQLALILHSVRVFAQTDQGTIVVRPKEIDDVLTNPGIGFTTFQMFNGDNLLPNVDVLINPNIEDHQIKKNDLTNEGYPNTSIAYFRILWQFIEPIEGEYRWDYIDKLLEIAHKRNQTLMLRIAPYKGNPGTDVPTWYRKHVGENRDFAHQKWVVDPEDPQYSHYFGNMIRALGARYDGHPDLESVDLSIVGWAGEGGGTELLSDETTINLLDAYLESFKQTPLTALLHGKEAVDYIKSKREIGWRQDCLGDLGFWADDQNGWTHMYDYYPQTIIEYNMQDAWKKAAVTFESCADIIGWKNNQGYDEKDVKYIIDQSLKWHISSFNNKSSEIPVEWRPLIDEWQKKMGYRFVLRRFSYPKEVEHNGFLKFESWWENSGVAPCYRKYPLVIRLVNKRNSYTFLTDADIRDWLPGDIVYNNKIFVSKEIPSGLYQIQLALVEIFPTHEATPKAKIKLANEGITKDGWYDLGSVKVID